PNLIKTIAHLVSTDTNTTSLSSKTQLYYSTNPTTPLDMAAINFASTACSAGNRGQLTNSASVSRWQCCHCNYGWQNVDLETLCTACQVPRCGSCIYC
ncbi:hypothetical protein FOXYSP1_11445, partial [Fusarium oxysporum f. sp. phaseoli]